MAKKKIKALTDKQMDGILVNIKQVKADLLRVQKELVRLANDETADKEPTPRYKKMAKVLIKGWDLGNWIADAI